MKSLMEEMTPCAMMSMFATISCEEQFPGGVRGFRLWLRGGILEEVGEEEGEVGDYEEGDFGRIGSASFC